MIVMALDHTRDFIHHDAMLFAPTDLSKTNAILFFTRWITHFCAPVFMFTAGMGAYFWKQRGRTTGELSRYLLTRGLWLIFLELVVMRLAYYFTLSLQYPVLLLVLWSLGACMVALSILVYLPRRVLAALSLAVIVLHNLLDPIQAKQFGAAAPLWNVLHQVGAFPVAGVLVVVAYPLLSWIALIAAGYCFAPVLQMEPAARSKILLRVGGACVAGFLLLRAMNVYGDLQPWSSQHDAMFTILSFFNVTKQPPSLDFLLMTLGPALLLLALLDRKQLAASNPLVVLGRVPLFFFVTHFFAIHLVEVVMALIRYGRAAIPLMFVPPPSLGGSAELFPKDFGYPLWVAYLVWIVRCNRAYPVCRWYAGVKAGESRVGARRALSYL